MHYFGFVNKDFSPNRCPVCFYKDFEEIIVDTIEYTTMEKEVRCAKCKNLCGYWAFGYYQAIYI